MNDNECIFCQIAKGEIPTELLVNNDRVLAFYDMSPSAEKHILIIPRKHIGTFMDLTDDGLLDEMMKAAQKLISELDFGRGYRLVFNGGNFQHIPHLHWHLLGGELKSNLP